MISILIYKRIIDSNIEFALILEDDVDFDKNLIDILNAVEKFPRKLELLLLGHHSMDTRKKPTRCSIWYNKKINKKYILRRPATISHGTYDYFINNNGAKKILSHLGKITKPIDWYTGDDQYINLYVLQNPAILINNKLSDISNMMAYRGKMKKNYENKLYENNVLKLKYILIKIILKIKPIRMYK
jgi:glycosyl transferase family 25